MKLEQILVLQTGQDIDISINRYIDIDIAKKLSALHNIVGVCTNTDVAHLHWEVC